MLLLFFYYTIVIQPMRYFNLYILFLIFLSACFLRLYLFQEVPFTHDELSMLFRTYFHSFSELIEKGVMVDTHPAGIQVFVYYWISFFGSNEYIVKLPFVFFGLCSVILLYQIGKIWYNETVALIAASYIATLQYPIMYSQIARPYISGLFFSLLMVYFWSKIILYPTRYFYLNTAFFVLSSVLCAYNHHFSLLFAFIVGITGMFLVEKKYRVKYIFSGVLIFIFYIPHLRIFFYQLSIGGVEGWLGKPENDFILDYIKYIFHFSFYCFSLVVILVLVGWRSIDFTYFKSKHFLISFCWFLVPFLIGFFYSRYFSAILQFSVLLFSFPFFLFLLFGHLPEFKAKYNLIIVVVIILVNTLSLIYERQHYEVFYKSVYEELLRNHNNLIKDSNKIISIIDSHKQISEYYSAKNKVDSNFIWFDTFSTEKEFILFLEKKHATVDSLYLGVCSGNKPNTVSIVLNYFPTIRWQKNYFNGTAYLFTKSKIDNNSLDFLYYSSTLDFKKKQHNWTIPTTIKVIQPISSGDECSYSMDSSDEYGPLFTLDLNTLLINKHDYIDITVELLTSRNSEGPIIVTAIEEKGKNICWHGESCKNFYNARKERWVKTFFSTRISDCTNYKIKNSTVKILIWNKNKETFLIKNFNVRFRKGNSILYGLYENIND